MAHDVPGGWERGDIVVVAVVPTSADADLLCSLLHSEGIVCSHRKTNMAAAWRGDPFAGPRAVLVHEQDAIRARELIQTQ